MPETEKEGEWNDDAWMEDEDEDEEDTWLEEDEYEELDGEGEATK